MAEARQIELQPTAERVGGLELVVIAPNNPEAMQRHTEECRRLGFPFVADPSPQIAWLDGPRIKRLIHGATCLFVNDYEGVLITRKTGWSHEEILERGAVYVVTDGAKDSSVEIAGEPRLDIPVARGVVQADPTGVSALQRRIHCRPRLERAVGALCAARIASGDLRNRGNGNPGVSVRWHLVDLLRGGVRPDGRHGDWPPT
jgi:hypothetical protein